MFLQIVPKFQPQTLFTPKRNLAVFFSLSLSESGSSDDIFTYLRTKSLNDIHSMSLKNSSLSTFGAESGLINAGFPTVAV